LLTKRNSRSAPAQSTREASTIVISANSCWNIVNFRAGLIRALMNDGHQVVVVAPEDSHTAGVEELGAAFVPMAMNSAGLSIREDAGLFLRYLRLFRTLRPAAYLGFTAKPNIYGSLAAQAAGARVINNVSGLGTVFIKHGPVTRIVSALYRLSFRRSATVFFQNREDLQLFVANGLVAAARADLLPGSGIDLKHFVPPTQERRAGPFRFLFVGRLLWDKGVGEYVEAARLVRRDHPGVIFQMLGQLGVNNRTAVPSPELARWEAEGLIDYLGERDDVRGALSQADCVVLPSYREGLPRALLEGSAMGKPLIATDVPGCRDVVVDGETGYLCEVRSAASLAGAMSKILEGSDSQRSAMGARGRRKVELEFCQSRVIAKYLAALGGP
jgi:glycosyltransferase involved in cell wall biosynthesis